mgnify:CR=1 FL=1|jgi:LPXTG-motif cell wall-anchored protein
MITVKGATDRHQKRVEKERSKPTKDAKGKKKGGNKKILLIAGGIIVLGVAIYFIKKKKQDAIQGSNEI